MAQYLLSIYQPDGELPPPEFLDQVMRDLGAINDELRASGAWVFSPVFTRRARPRSCGWRTVRC